MGWQDNSGDGKGKKNPWGSNESGGSKGGGRNPWGSGNGGGYGRGEPPPDLEEMLRRAQENLRQVMPGGFKGGSIAVLIVVAGVLLWLASGFYIIEPGVHGVVQRFGAWERTQVDEGLGYHLPVPIETVEKVNVSELRRMEIGFSERVARGGSGQAQDIPEESLMLTSDANIVDIDLVVLWNINSAEDFLFNIVDQENTIKKVAESAIREVVGQTRMFPIITQARDEVAARARAIMTENLDRYQSGVNISQVLIREAEVHPDVQDAFQDVQSAKQDAFDTQNRAAAYREDILPRARGQAIQVLQEAQAYKQSVTARAQGDAGRFNSIYQAYLTGEDVTKKRLYIETMEEVLKNAQKIIIDESSQGSGVVPYLPLNEMTSSTGRSARPSAQSGNGAQGQ